VLDATHVQYLRAAVATNATDAAATAALDAVLKEAAARAASGEAGEKEVWYEARCASCSGLPARLPPARP
jgi:cytochrome c5